MNRRDFLAITGGLAAGGLLGVSAIGTTQPAVAAEANDTAGQDSGGTATAAVTRGDLSTEREFRASISFGDPWVLNTAAAGIVTNSRAEGAVVGFGEELVRVDDRPLFLAGGTMPLYRELYKVDTRARDEDGKRLSSLTGPDVEQLQEFLLAAGHDAGGELTVDGIFSTDTERAVKSWQKALDRRATGRVDSSQLVFEPQPVRIDTSVRVGSTFEMLQVSRAVASVLVDTSNRDRGVLAPGTSVDVTLPDGTTVTGRAVEQSQVTGADGSRVWRTTIDAGALPSEASTATVTVEDIVANDVLLVPASALLALAEGGFALEVLDGQLTDLVRVEVGEVLDGLAEITGDVEPGATVVVPA